MIRLKPRETKTLHYYVASFSWSAAFPYYRNIVVGESFALVLIKHNVRAV